MKYEVKKIDLLTVAVFSGLFYGLIGLVPMVFGLIAFFSRVLSQGFNIEILFFLLFPVGAFIGGFIVGLIFAVIYNAIAEHWRGVKLEINYTEKSSDEQ